MTTYSLFYYSNISRQNFKQISRYRVGVEDDRQVGPALRRRVAEHEEGNQAEPQEGERQDQELAPR